MKTIFLVDGDNNIGTGLTGVDMLSDQDTVLIFYQKEKGLALSKLQKLCAGTAADVQYIESVRGGKNSIDFQIITELGVLVGKRKRTTPTSSARTRATPPPSTLSRPGTPTRSRRWPSAPPSRAASTCPSSSARRTARSCATPW